MRGDLYLSMRRNNIICTHLGGLANLLADHLPLVVLVVFNRLEQRSTLSARQRNFPCHWGRG